MNDSEPHVTRLLARLDQIGQSLAKTGQGLALLGLGSVGSERDRLDQYSDLDFFAVVKAGARPQLLVDIRWLAEPCPVVYQFANTPDGFKYLYEDGIFCEMAVMETDQLQQIPLVGAHLVWHDPAFDPSFTTPTPSQPAPRSADWLMNEALTNLYVGLGRYHRGEKLSAQRFIQHYAVDRIVEMAASLAAAQPGHPDIFTPERRFEQRYPDLAAHLPAFVQGYARSVESARAILEFLDAHFAVNPALRQAILRLCAPS
jgi:lincosamide nucleotidyltransferase B/F